MNIKIIDGRFWVQTLLTMELLSISIGPIALGALLDSAAMQWVGFVMGITVSFGYAYQKDEMMKFKSVDAAIKHLEGLK